MGVRKRLSGGVLTVLIAALLAGCTSGVDADESSSVIASAMVTATAPASASASAAASASASEEAQASPAASPSDSETASASSAAPTSKPEASQPPPSKPADPSPAPSASAGAPAASASPSVPPAETKPFFTISIVGIGDWGTIVNAEQADLKDGDTPASALKRVAKAHRLAYEIRGSGALTYVEGIDGLYEFDYGPTSGWKFSVNGKVSDIGAGVYKLNSGDRLEWYYVERDEMAESGSESVEAQP